MTLGLVGRKVGMTRVFTDDGDSLPVTVLDVSDNRVTQIKSGATDGYSAVQVTFGKRRASRVNKAAAGHFARAAVEAGHILREFRVPERDRKSTRLNSSHLVISYAVFCLKKKKKKQSEVRSSIHTQQNEKSYT